MYDIMRTNRLELQKEKLFQPARETRENPGDSARGGADLPWYLRLRALTSHPAATQGRGVHLSGSGCHCRRSTQPKLSGISSFSKFYITTSGFR